MILMCRGISGERLTIPAPELVGRPRVEERRLAELRRQHGYKWTTEGWVVREVPAKPPSELKPPVPAKPRPGTFDRMVKAEELPERLQWIGDLSAVQMQELKDERPGAFYGIVAHVEGRIPIVEESQFRGITNGLVAVFGVEPGNDVE